MKRYPHISIPHLASGQFCIPEAPLLHARIKSLLGIGTDEAMEWYKLDRAAEILQEG